MTVNSKLMALIVQLVGTLFYIGSFISIIFYIAVEFNVLWLLCSIAAFVFGVYLICLPIDNKPRYYLSLIMTPLLFFFFAHILDLINVVRSPFIIALISIFMSISTVILFVKLAGHPSQEGD